MPIHPVQLIVEGGPTFEVSLKDILAELKEGGALQTLSPLEYHTDRQRRWYKGVCLRGLADWNGETPEEWDDRLKDECQGLALLKKEIWRGKERLTTKGVGKRNMTAFIENILSKAIERDWPITPPDPELRTV